MTLHNKQKVKCKVVYPLLFLQNLVSVYILHFVDYRDGGICGEVVSLS